jgi:CheY-like chemotaxis protein
LKHIKAKYGSKANQGKVQYSASPYQLVERLTNKNILVVDDNEDITDMIKSMLVSSPYSCMTANTGIQCIDLVKQQNFDLILLDMAMPEMSGIDVLTKLKENNLAQQTKIVLVTASPMYTEMDLKKIREDYGAIERVKKPFTDEELLAVIEKYIG